MGFERNPTPKKPAAPTTSPVGDQHAQAGIKKANKYKAKPAYRKAIRQTYEQQPVPVRQAIAKNVAKTAAHAPKPKPVDRKAIAAYKGLSQSQQSAVRHQLALQLAKRSTATTIARVHDQRHATDLEQLNELGFLAREKYGYTPKADATNVMPKQNLRLSPAYLKGVGVGVTDRTPSASDNIHDRYDDTSAVLPTNHMPGDDPAALAKAKELGWSHATYLKNKDLLSKRPSEKGFNKAGFFDKAFELPALVVPGAVKSAAALGEATYHDPVGVPVKTAKQLALAVPGSFAGAFNTVVHPLDTGKGIVDAMYQSYAEPYHKKVESIRKHGGLQDISNVATLLGPSSRALALSKFGPLERAGLRVSGGLVKDRKLRSGVISGLAGQGIDKLKGRHYESLAAKDKTLTGQQRAALLANREAGRVVEVVPNRVSKKVIRDVAKIRGRGVNELHYDLSKGDFGQASKKLGKLDKHEQKALWFSAAGVRTPKQAEDLLPQLKQRILDERAGTEPKGRYKKMDMVKRIDEVLADPAKHFTPHLDEVMNSVAPHVEAISARDPRYADLTKENRRRADQNVLMDLHQGVSHEPGTPPRTMYHVVRDTAVASDTKLASIEKDGIKPSSNGHTYLYDDLAQAEKFAGGGGKILRVNVDGLDLGGAEGAATRTVRGTIPADRIIHDGELSALKYADETDAEFVARGDAKAAAEGLRKPMYFKAERHRGDQPDHSAFAVGGGRAMAYEGKFEGKNLRRGVLDMSERAFLRGYARNVKAAHNWPMVAKMIDRHAYHDLTPGPGLDVGQALDAINEATPLIKPGDVSLINPGIFERALRDDADSIDEGAGAPEEFGSSNTIAAINAAKFTPTAGGAIPPKFAKTSGWKAVPTSMLRELEAELTAGTKAGRVADILKGKASRAILLQGNVPWLAIQTASEGGITALATKGGALSPVNWLGTKAWWQGMTHEQRMEVSGVLGLNSTAGDWKQLRLGSVSSGGFVNAYRAMKEAPIWHKDRAWLAGHGVSELNPAELMAAADRGKTNITRLLLAHSELKKAAVADMAKNMSLADAATTRLLSVFKSPVAEQFEQLRKNPKLLEDVGDTTVKWLGDWTSMTAAERKLGHFVMFYPYVRYATRLLFYTLPVGHPIVATAMAELGQFTQTEYQQIFGDDDLPWNIGKIYFGKTGDSKYIDLSRANPLMTSFISGLTRIGTTSNNPAGTIAGVLPPYGQWIFDQLSGVNSFKGRNLHFNGDTDPFRTNFNIDAAHGKLLLAQVQSLFYPAREAMSALHPETQSDDSSLAFPIPMKYKKSTQIKGNGASVKIRRLTAQNAEQGQAFAKKHGGGIAGLALGPLLPTASRDAAASKNRMYIKKLQAKADATAAKRKAYRDAHGGKNPPSQKSMNAGNSVFGGSSGNSVF